VLFRSNKQLRLRAFATARSAKKDNCLRIHELSITKNYNFANKKIVLEL
jgi:hypothetical protein